jgi:histidinol-phosphate aminotransferase
MSDDAVRALIRARTPEALAELCAYAPDPVVVPVRLDANEAPALLPTLSPEERACWEQAARAVEPARYPDVRATALRALLSERLHVSPDQLVLGVGSDEVIAILLATLARSLDGRPPCILVPGPTFVMYRISARVHGFDVVSVPLDRDWDLDEPRMLEAIRAHRPAVVFLATPNNPTSGAYDRDKVARIVEQAGRNDPPTVVVIDEAYLPFRLAGDDPWKGETGLDFLRRDPHVVVLRTLSKIGLAALRVGWAVAHPLLAAEMEKVRLPYNLPTPSQSLAACALGPLSTALDRHVAAVARERARLLDELRRHPRASFGRTDANFVWLALDGVTGAEVTTSLKARGVLVRNFAAHPDRIRVSVGTRAESDAFLAALAATLEAR